MTGPVLVVDDDVDAIEDLRALLSSDGFEVLSAQNGREAFELLLATKPEPCVVVLDLHMPVMDGWQLLALMRTYSRLAQIPVVLLSGTSVTPSAHAAFDEVLRKPVTPAAVTKTVNLWSTRRHRSRP